ncbi:hypothetical protein CFT12S02855_07300 [Campylobacter fetus subsp. testudinum]|uniref:MmcQ/YjbR family DNA-binding protein n=1 Tax=Campylobacter fetus TaxID=196 RepID=UPI0008188AA3|nr:MmcQ/YjbR family DNA-binding protein [Campylobacter fetus]OCR97381.1 hypothetical protein CFT12S02855_07300 [Campylobacter fetus subsp. testudinum]
MTAETVFKYVKEKYGTIPDYPWIKTANHAVLRHIENQKWYGVIINIPKNKLKLDGDDLVDVLNLRCEKDLTILLKDGKTILPAYHMNKKNWISILLKETSDEMIFDLIAQSYELTL